MKLRKILTGLSLCLGVLLAGQCLVTLSEFGQAIDNSAVYANLQQSKNQAELKKSQLLTQYATQQALTVFDRNELLAQGYIKIDQALVLAADNAALASNLSRPAELE